MVVNRQIVLTCIVQLLGLLCFNSWAKAQDEANYEWSRRMGGAGFLYPGIPIPIGSSADEANATAVDAAGNVYITGYFNGSSVDFDPGPGVDTFSAGVTDDIFIAKYDASGKYMWARCIEPGGAGTEKAHALAVDAAGNVYVTGYFGGVTDFDPGDSTFYLSTISTATNGYDIFLLKLNASGNFVWARQMGSLTAEDRGLGIALDKKGNIYITGTFSDTADFDPAADTAQLVSAGETDVFLAKYDTGGHYKWAISMGGPRISGSNNGADIGNAVAVDTAGNAYITGSFRNRVDFDPGPDTAILTGVGDDVFVAKYDANGQYLWAKRMGGAGADVGNGLAVDAPGTVYIAGIFRGSTADFDPGPDTFNLTDARQDVFLVKLDASGNFVWASQMGGSASDGAWAITLDAAANVYLTGNFASISADFDPGPDTAMLYSATGRLWVAKYNAGGKYLWAKNMGGSSTFGRAIAVDVARSVYVAGGFTGTGDFDPGSGIDTLRSAGGYDIFLLKLSQPSCITGSSIAASACGSYTLNGQTYTATGTYTQTLLNAAQCDSIITLNLVINNNANTVTQKACDSFLFGTQKLTATGTYTHTFTNAALCDSLVTLHLTISRSSINPVVNGKYCDSATFNGITYKTTGHYVQKYTNAAGCDSNIAYDITIGTSSTPGRIIQTVCDSFVFQERVFATTGIYEIVLENAGGCDSLVILDLTVNKSPRASVVLTGLMLTANSADSYAWIDCDNNLIIPGAESQTYTPVQSGNYAVIIGQNGCSDTSDCVAVTVPGSLVSTWGMNNSLLLYPNPTAGMITIETGKALQDATIRLVNLVGQTLAIYTHLQGTLCTLDMVKYPAGVYFAVVTENGRTTSIKVGKE